VRQIEPTPQTVNNVVLYNALFDVDNPDRLLMTQMTAQVFFVTSQAKDAVQVPLTALRPFTTGSTERRQTNPDAKGSNTARPTQPGSAGRSGDNAGDPRTRFTNGRAIVRVIKPDRTVEDREVRVGVMTRVSAQIISGVEPGEQIVSGSASPKPAAAAAKAGNNNAPRMQPRI
jgi:macrolide-specific efflux system membrane fusion protein